MKPVISFPLALGLAIMGIFGLIFLSTLGILNLLGAPQIVEGGSQDSQSAAVRACFISAAIYGCLGIAALSQLYIHKSGGLNGGNPLSERNLAIELVTLDPNDEANPKSNTPLTRPSSVASVDKRYPGQKGE